MSDIGFSWRITTLEFKSGEKLKLPPASLTILVGPNNGGKTTILKDVLALLRGSEGPVVSLRTLLWSVGNLVESRVRTWVDDRFPVHSRDGVHYYTVIVTATRQGLVADVKSLLSTREPDRLPLPGVCPHFMVEFLPAENRLDETSMVAPARSIDHTRASRYTLLQTADSVAFAVYEEVRAAFGVAVVPTWGPAQMGFRAIENPEDMELGERFAAAYGALQDKPTLGEQGLGIRGYVGVLLGTLWAATPVLLIDEPQLYLHQPQARRLGGFLARQATDRDRQIVVATHSAEFILGALDANASVQICRITRQGDGTHVALLDSGVLAELLSRPLLRSAKATDGLFHEGVVVCESNDDCCFYRALLDRARGSGKAESVSDLYFAHGHGSSSLRFLVDCYARAGVPVAPVADLDILGQRGDLKWIWKALGGDFSAVQEELDRLVELKRDGGKAKWADLAEECRGLVETCSKKGLFIVPVGELEDWWGGELGKGDGKSEFVRAMEMVFEKPSSFQDAESFVLQIGDYLRARDNGTSDAEAK